MKYLDIAKGVDPVGVLPMFVTSERGIYFDDNYLQISSFPTTLFVDRQGNFVDRQGNIVKRASSVNWRHLDMTAIMKAFREGNPIPDLPNMQE